MELVGEDESVLELKEGQPLVLGRVARLSHHDGSVSRHQVVVDLLRPSSRKGKEVAGQSGGLKLQVQVVGRNPICVVNRGREESSKPEVKFLCNGQKDWLTAGDKISLSIRQPFFYELKSEGRSGPSSANASHHTQANFNRVEGVPDKRNGDDSKSAEVDEEAGIAEAVARRQRRKLEREEETHSHRQVQHQKEEVGLKKRKTDEPEHEKQKADNGRSVQKSASSWGVETGEQTRNEQEELLHLQGNGGILSMDPVAEFGFIVEGSEFSAYDKKIMANKRIWRPDIGGDERVEDDFSEHEEMSSARGGLYELGNHRTVVKKSHASGDDEEWGGDNEAEQDRLKVAAEKKGQMRMATRRIGRKSTSNSGEKCEGQSMKSPNGIQDVSDEDSDDSTGSLDDFIVDDEESVEEDEEENEDDENDLGDSRKGGSKTGVENRKPECKYGSKCYRKNAEHRAQFYHPSS